MKILRWLLLCPLASCAAGPPAPGPQACAVEKQAEVPLTSQAGFATIPAQIEGKPVTMLVDTGSERTIVTPAAVSTLRLQPDPHARTTINGTGGSVTTQNVRLQSFGVGALEMLDQSTAVGRLPNGDAPGSRASGLLGADWLDDFVTDFDLPHRRLTLYRAEGCSGDYLPWRGVRASVAVRRYGRGVILVPVVLDGAPMTAVLDSGANRSIVSDDAAARAGADAAALAGDPAGHSTGIDGNPQATHLHQFGRLDIGTDHIRMPRVTVGPLHAAGGAEMLLGLDWLRNHRVWIDDRNRTVFIQPAAPAG